VQPGDQPKPRRRVVPQWLRNSVVVFVALLVIEYLVVPELVGASKDLSLLGKLNVGWLVAAVVLEAGSVLAYALLTRALLLGEKPSLSRLVRMVLATTAIAHVVPGGAAGGAGLGYQLLTSDGVEGTDAGFALATTAIGSALLLNVLLWASLLVSIPLAGLHPVYVATAVAGLVVLGAAGALVYTFTRGEERSVRFVRGLGRRLPRVGADRLEHLLREARQSLGDLARDRGLLTRALVWAGLNWLLDAASLWSFLAALGHFVDPFELFSAYGIANVVGASPSPPAASGSSRRLPPPCS
jgi:uncharacterized protein (TIRG00374 family)